jgi:two-component system, cell cycle sensor histidine kinase and response regulator CckA
MGTNQTPDSGAERRHDESPRESSALKALQASETRYRRLFESAKDGILILDAETGMVVDVNPFLLKLLGYSREAFLTKKVWELGFLKETIANEDMFRELQAKNYVRYEDLPLESSDGRSIEVEFVSNVYLVNEQRVIQCNIRDITERKRAEEDLRRFKTISDNAVYGKAIADLQGNLLYINRFFANIHGYEPGELVGKHLSLFHCQEQMEAVGRLNASMMQQGQYAPTTVWHRHKDGTDFPMLMSGVLIRDDHGKPQCIAASAVDMTAQHKAAAKLVESEEKYRNLVEGLNDAVYRMTLPEGRYDYFSSSAEDVFGYTREEFINNPLLIQSIIHPDSAGYFEDKWKELSEGIVQETYEYKIIDPEGNERWIVQSNKAIFDDSGQIKAIEGLCRNITERKQAEVLLREKTDLLQNITDHMFDLVAITDLSGVFSYAGPSHRILGFEPEELLGTSVFDYVHPDDAGYIAKEFAELSANPAPEVTRTVEYRQRCADGNYKWLETKGKFLFSDDLIPYALFFSSREITERKRAAEEQQKLHTQLQQAMKMEAVGRLAGGVAHDFNNLLTSITGNVQLSLMDLSPGDPMEDSLTEIAQAADSAASLTRQLLAFSRKQLIEPKVLNLNELVVSLHKMLTRLIGEDIRLKTIPGKQLGSVKIDPGQIEQILVNLAVNARDAMPDGGKLIIETANTELDEDYCRLHPHSKLGAHVMLAVSDTGIGMNDEVKSHLFEPFFTTKPKERGTGLGLATIYGAVKQAGGSVEVYSEEGEGTTFKIYLPLVAEKAERLKAAAPIIDMPGGDETVLIVEDEKSVRDMAIRILKRLGYNVLQAPDGGQAFMLAEKYTDKIDLLMTDVIMPGMNGRQLAERLIQIHPEMKVLYTSGYTENTIAHHGVIDEGLHFIGKPYTPQALAKKLRDVLER